MLLDAGSIFDKYEAELSSEIGTFESVSAFRKEYITPTFEADSRAGQEIEAAFLEAITDNQRESFIVGFKTAIQLIMSCTPGGGVAGG